MRGLLLGMLALALPAGEWNESPLEAVPEEPAGFGGFHRLDDGRGAMPFAGGRLDYRVHQGGLLLDRNRDGCLDGRDLPVLGQGQAAVLSLPFGSATLAYPLRLSHFQSHYAMLAAGVRLRTRVAGRELWLGDPDCVGSFDGVALAEHQRPLPLGRVLELEGRLYEVELRQEAGRLAWRPWTGPVARLRWPAPVDGGTKGEGRLFGGEAVAELRSGSEVLLPPGRYRVESCQLRLQLPGRKAPCPLFGGQGTITVAEGAQDLPLGDSFSLGFRASAAGDGRIILDDAWLADPAGIRFRPALQGVKGEAWLLVRDRGDEARLAKVEYG